MRAQKRRKPPKIRGRGKSMRLDSKTQITEYPQGGKCVTAYYTLDSIHTEQDGIAWIADVLKGRIEIIDIVGVQLANLESGEKVWRDPSEVSWESLIDESEHHDVDFILISGYRGEEFASVSIDLRSGTITVICRPCDLPAMEKELALV